MDESAHLKVVSHRDNSVKILAGGFDLEDRAVPIWPSDDAVNAATKPLVNRIKTKVLHIKLNVAQSRVMRPPPEQLCHHLLLFTPALHKKIVGVLWAVARFQVPVPLSRFVPETQRIGVVAAGGPAFGSFLVPLCVSLHFLPQLKV